MFGLVGLSFVLLAGTPATGVLEQDETAKLQVGVSKSPPGTEARISLVLLLADDGPRPRALDARVCFADALVRLRTVEQGPAARTAGARLDQAVERRLEQACVRLEFEFKEPIESGTLAELIFEVQADAPLDSVVELKGEMRLAGAAGAVPALVRNGSITVVERTPIFGCYFYMH